MSAVNATNTLPMETAGRTHRFRRTARPAPTSLPVSPAYVGTDPIALLVSQLGILLRPAVEASNKPAKKEKAGKAVKTEDSLAVQFVDEASKNTFGELAVEAKDEAKIVRRWTGSFWKVMNNLDGEAEAVDWLMTTNRSRATSSAARDCWNTLGLHHHKHKPFQRVAPTKDHAILPFQDGYFHITKDRAWMEAPNKTLGLTFEVRAKVGAAHGQDFARKAIPAESLFGKFLDSSLPDLEVRRLVQEQCAMTYLPNAFQSMSWWVSDGGAGKGTLAKLVEKLHYKVATLDLHKLDDPHHLEALIDATIIRIDEVSQKGQWCEKAFKSLISGDVVSVNPKHKTAYTQCFHLGALATSNQGPLIRDDTDGVRRRIVVVPWPGSAKTRGHSVADLDKLIFEQEADLFLSWLVEGMQRFMTRGRPMAGSELPAVVRKAMTDLHRTNDYVETWFQDCEIIPAMGVSHTKKEIYENFKAYLVANDVERMPSAQQFFMKFWRRQGLETGGVVERRLSTEGRPWVIDNLAITPREVANEKKKQLEAKALAEGRIQSIPVVVDFFGPNPDETTGEFVDRPDYTTEEQEELMRLEALAKLHS